jgi:DNA processing protein
MKLNDTAMHCALALSFADGIGPIKAKKLLRFYGDPEAIFQDLKTAKSLPEGLTNRMLSSVRAAQTWRRAELEMRRAEKESWQIHFYQDSAYPHRMRHAEDAPIIIFQKGHSNLNANRILAMVGTRQMSDYGRQFIHSFVEETLPYGLEVISGLAYGVDAASHRRAIELGVKTHAIVAHGLDRIYPSLHRRMAEDLLADGGSILSEFPSGTKPDRENFPKRNRIIAAMSDAVLVVEAARKGGALITADLANQYNRDVFAVPGRHNDLLSEGCNHLIKSHRANLLETIKDLSYVMQWDKKEGRVVAPQMQLFNDLAENEQAIVACLSSSKEPKGLEWIRNMSGFKQSDILSLLMSLELKSIVQCMPGPRYRLN